MDDEAFFTDDIIKGKSVMGYSPVGGSGGQNELLRAGALDIPTETETLDFGWMSVRTGDRRMK